MRMNTGVSRSRRVSKRISERGVSMIAHEVSRTSRGGAFVDRPVGELVQDVGQHAV